MNAVRVAMIVAIISSLGADAALALCRGNYDKTPAAQRLPSELPEGCIGRWRTPVSAFLAGVFPDSSRYPDFTSIQKRDVVCFGDRITVDIPIYTNGGDVVIHAAELVLTAPIDSRIYFSTDRFEKVLPRVWSTLQGYQVVDLYAADEPCSSPQVYHEGLLAYDYYYSVCQDCIFTDQNSLVPRMPDGPVPQTVLYARMSQRFVASPGRDAPTYDHLDRDVLRSGDITLYYSRLDTPATVENSHRDFGCSMATFGENQEARLLIADGLYGGRGSPGHLSPAPYPRAIGRFSLMNDAYTVTGNSGYGGPGGDAGDITFGLLFTSETESVARPNETVVSAQGGTGGLTTSFTAPAAYGSGLPFASTGQVCDFYNDGRIAGSIEPRPAGQDGSIQVVRFSGSEGLATAYQRFLAETVSLDIERDYGPLIVPENGIGDLVGSSPFLRSLNILLAKEVLESQRLLLNDLREAMFGRPQQLRSPFLGGFSLEQIQILIANGLDGDQARLLQELGRVLNDMTRRAAPGPQIATFQYFFEHRGLFNLQTSRADLMDALSRLLEISYQQMIDTTFMREQVQGLAYRRRVDVLEDNEVAIKKDAESVGRVIAELSAIIAAGPSESSLGDTFKPLKTMVELGIAAYAQYQSGDWMGLTATAPELYSAVADLNSSLSDTSQENAYYSAMRQLPELRAQLRQLEIALFNQTAVVARSLERLDEQEQSAFATLSSGQSVIDDQVIDRAVRFPELLRWTLISYMLDQTADAAELARRLDALEDYLGGAGWNLSQFRFGSVESFRCDGDPNSGRCRTAQLVDGGIEWDGQVWNVGDDPILITDLYLPDGTVVQLPAYTRMRRGPLTSINHFSMFVRPAVVFVVQQ